MPLAVRTTTALYTSPFLTRPRGAASLMVPLLLSATSNRDSVWIISIFPTCIPEPPTRRQAPEESVLDPSSLPRTTRSASDWADNCAPNEGEALYYHKNPRCSQLFPEFSFEHCSPGEKGTEMDSNGPRRPKASASGDNRRHPTQHIPIWTPISSTLPSLAAATWPAPSSAA